MSRPRASIQATVFFLALVLAEAGPAAAETLEGVRASGILNICANPEALPYTSDTGDLPGFQIELQREIARLQGWQPTVTWVFNQLAAGRLRCGGFMGRMITAISPPPKDYLITEPYMGSGFVFVLPPGSRTNYSDLRDLLSQTSLRSNRPIGILLGAWIGGVIERAGGRAAPFIYQEQIIEAVLAGDLAAGVVARENAAWYLRRKPGVFAQYEIFRSDPSFRWNVGMGMRESNPALIEVLNASLAELRANGALEQILLKYGLTYLAPFPES